jgi:ATP/ADP translocase/HEAT repeat protein
LSAQRGAGAAFLETALRVRPGEGRRVALLFLQLLLASSVFILGRTVRDTLFLSRYPIRYLPWMFVLYGVVSAIVVVVYSRYADRVPRQRMIAATSAIGIGTYLATWGLVRAEQAWIYPAFYVWAEVVANLFIVQFWTLANDLFDARAGKRLFGTIGSARVLGVVLVGLGTGAVVTAIGTAQLLFVLAAMMAGIAGCAVLVGREPRADSAERAGLRARRRGHPPTIFGDPYVRALALMILLVFVSLTIGDYQFKRIARDAYQEDALARFFSLFYAGTGIVSFIFQIVLTPRILARLGVGTGMTVMPSVFGAFSVALLFGPRLAVATVMKFADNGFQYTIHETTLQALYVPFAAEVKARTRAMLDAVVKPLSYGAGGVALVLLVPLLDVHQLSFVTVPLVVAWIALIPLVRRRYLRSLEATLSARGALALESEDFLDAGGRRALLSTLERGEPRQVLVALEQVAGEQHVEVRDAVARLTAHPDHAVRTAALYQVAATAHGDRASTRRSLSHPDPDVRAAAAAAFAALAEDEGIEALEVAFEDPHPDVRVAALAGVLRHGGVDGAVVGGAELGRLLESQDTNDAVSAARVLRHLGSAAFRPLLRLLEHPDARVRRAALKAAPGVADPRLITMLLQLLHEPATRQRAGNALVAVGSAAVWPLTAALDSPATPRVVRLIIPRILRRIAHPDTYARLREHVTTQDSHLRLRIISALSRLRRELGRAPEPLAWVRERVTEEIADAARSLVGWTRARGTFDSPLLDEEFQLRRGRSVWRVLRLLELRYDREPIDRVRTRLGDPARRANALEVLDTLLEPSLRPVVMPFVDEVPEEVRLSRAEAIAGPAPEPETFLRAECRHPNPYVALLALDALATHGAMTAEDAAPLLDHPDALVREGARLAAGERSLEAGMYSTLEKVLLLKRAPVFERVTGEDLAPLARLAEVTVYSEGDEIVREGDLGDALLVILRGSVAISRAGHQVATLGAGETIGEMSILDHEPRSATAIALEETEVLEIGSAEFYEILHEHEEIAEGVIRTLSQRLREATAELSGERTE